MILSKKYIAKWVVYNFLGIKCKFKSKPVHIDKINLILDDNYGIGNRIFSIVNAIEYYTPKLLSIYWNNKGWVDKSFKELFDYKFDCEIKEFEEVQKDWKNSKNERTIYYPQASIITFDGIERTLANKNITDSIRNIYSEIFSKIKPSEKVMENINKIKLPESYIALQIRNAPDWNKYGRNENLDKFLDEMSKYSCNTIFYLSCMNKETSDYIKTKNKHKIIELPNKNYNSMYDAVADLYIMSKAKSGIYSFGSTFGELAWWLAENNQPYTIIGSDENWKWMK